MRVHGGEVIYAIFGIYCSFLYEEYIQCHRCLERRVTVFNESRMGVYLYNFWKLLSFDVGVRAGKVNTYIFEIH